MANPWEAYGVPAQGAEGPPEEGLMDTPAAPVPSPSAPWSEYAGLEGTVTDESPYPIDDSGIAVTHGGPLGRQPVDAGEAAGRGWNSAWTLGFDDEIGAGAYAGMRKLLSLAGAKADDRTIGRMYRDRVAQLRQEKDDAWSDSPWAYAAGAAPGVLGTGALFGAAAPASWGRYGTAAAAGAAEGGLSGAGNADSGFWSTMAGAGTGAALGGGLGALSVPVADLVGGAATRAWRALRPDAGADSGLGVLASRAPQDVSAMRETAQRFADAGVPARLADVVDASGRGVIRDAASKMTPGRQAVVDHAKAVRTRSPDDIVELAQRELSADPQTSRQLTRQIRGDRNLGGENEVGVLMGQQMDPLRGRAITMDDDLKDLLRTGVGQAALRKVRSVTTDRAKQAELLDVIGAARKSAKGPLDPEDAFRAEVKGWDELPDAVKDAYRAQRPDLAEAADPLDGKSLDLDTLDKLVRAVAGRKTATEGLEAEVQNLSRTARESARRQVPEYDEALNQYEAGQRVGDAASGAGRFEESSFLGTVPDTYEASVSQASRTPAAVRPQTEAGEVLDPTVSEHDALILRARDELADAATADSGARAPALARQLSPMGVAQQRRSEALVGPERAERLREGGRALDERYYNTGYINPDAGSKTMGAAQDAIVDGFADAAANAASGGKWGLIRTAGRWLKQGGIKGVDAERLARDAISEDPARVRAAIDYLEQKGMARARAERFVSVYGGALAGRTGGAATGED